jgi:GTP-binding protein
LGVDLLPGKICSYGCIYCQQGATARAGVKRFSRVDLVELKRQLKQLLLSKPHIDYVTISGSGEPTLHKNLDKVIAVINSVTKHKYPICVITNGSLLYDKQVRKELLKADMVMPSLDGCDEKTFTAIDMPEKSLKFNMVVDGLIQFRREYKGEYWLEIMLIKGINDNKVSFLKFKKLVEAIKPDKVQINLPARPAPHNK